MLPQPIPEVSYSAKADYIIRNLLDIQVQL